MEACNVGEGRRKVRATDQRGVMMSQTRAGPGSKERETGQTHNMLGEMIRRHRNSTNMRVGQGEKR